MCWWLMKVIVFCAGGYRHVLVVNEGNCFLCWWLLKCNCFLSLFAQCGSGYQHS